jgi:hypothetical protein
MPDPCLDVPRNPWCPHNVAEPPVYPVPGGPYPLVALSRLDVSPATFAAADSGPSATAARRAARGALVTYTLNQPASVRFGIRRRLSGRRGSHGRCVKPTHANRHHAGCTRFVSVRGSLTRPGAASPNRFRFTGRLNGHKLAPGRYVLTATPTAGGRIGTTRTTPFRIVRA